MAGNGKFKRRGDFQVVPAQSLGEATADDPKAGEATSSTADTPRQVALGAIPIPATHLRVTANYGFYADDGAFCAWAEGTIVTDQAEIELLTGRKAPVERIEP